MPHIDMLFTDNILTNVAVLEIVMLTIKQITMLERSHLTYLPQNIPKYVLLFIG